MAYLVQRARLPLPCGTPQKIMDLSDVLNKSALKHESSTCKPEKDEVIEIGSRI